MGQISAKKAGFSKAHVDAFKTLEAFKAWYDPIFKDVSAVDIWKSIGGTVPKKEAKK